MTKHYYAIFNLIILTAFIFTGVDIFYKITCSRISQVSTDDVVMQQTPDTERQKKSPLTNFSIITDRNLFGSHKKASEEIKPDEEIEELEPTSLNIALLGTVSGDQQNARAVIEEFEKRKQALYKVGDSVQEAVIKKILRGKVILGLDDKDEVLAMKEPSSLGASELTSPRRLSREMPRSFYQKTPGMVSTITVNRSDIHESLRDINQLLSQARIQPHFRDGRADGLVVSRIKRGSVFSKLGLRNGDIVQRINNSPLNNPEEILSFYEKLKTGSRASLQITRRGRQKTLNYRFR